MSLGKILKWTVAIAAAAAVVGGAAGWVISAQKPDKPAFVSVVQPVRGREYWFLGSTLESFAASYAAVVSRNLPVTWLLSYDVLADLPLVDIIKEFNSSQEAGLWLEVTPALATAAGVEYHTGPGWWRANNVLLSGYSVAERRRLIDTVVEKYRQEFGRLPTSIGAWHLGAGELRYLRQKYQVTAAMIVADQLTTDGYGVWGQYWAAPYYPSSRHALHPANTLGTKIDLVVSQWAPRDPELGYGGSVDDSTYSLQDGDYQRHNKDIAYFRQLFDLYSTPGVNKFAQVVIGQEAGFPLSQYHDSEYTRQLDYVADKVTSGTVRAVTLTEFAVWYRRAFPRLSPWQTTKTDAAIWISHPWFRLGLVKRDGRWLVRDLRFYANWVGEEFFDRPNGAITLDTEAQAVVDAARIAIAGWPPLAVVSRLTIPLPGRLAFAWLALIWVGTAAGATVFSWSRLPRPQLELPVYLATGISGGTLAVYLLSVVRLGWLVFPLTVAVAVWSLYRHRVVVGAIKSTAEYFRHHRWTTGVFVAGNATWLLTAIKNFTPSVWGYGFWGAHGHDAVWHLAIIESLKRGWPPANPLYTGTILKNYHYFFDLWVAYLSKATSVPAPDVYFRLALPALGLLVGLVVLNWLSTWISDEKTLAWTQFFVYFGGSWGWLVSLIRNQNLGGESMFWSHQAISTLVNPPFAASVIFLFLGWWILTNMDERAWRQLLVLAMVWGSLAAWKVYAAILVVPVLGGWAVSRFFRRKFRPVVILAGWSGAIWAVTFLPLQQAAGSLVVWAPFWLVNSALAPDRFNWLKLQSAIEVYWVTKNFKWLPAQTLAMVVFLVGNLGTRLLGIIALVRKTVPTRSDMVTVLATALLASSLFIQKGTPWNTVQFIYYLLLVMGVLAGLTVAKWPKWAVIGVVALTIPTTLEGLRHYLPSRPPAVLPYPEVAALKFLSRQPPGTVLTYPYLESNRGVYPAPRPLFAYETTAYVAAFSGQPAYLNDEVNGLILGLDVEGRRKIVQLIFASQDHQRVSQLLKDNDIRYVYLVHSGGVDQRLTVHPETVGLTKIFANSQVTIWARL